MGKASRRKKDRRLLEDFQLAPIPADGVPLTPELVETLVYEIGWKRETLETALKSGWFYSYANNALFMP